ncbi:hypothetical protein [Halovenus sp. HT40]|uniref:hypothetical protein n=1 Tax=Halovenus sp. HT40 TaxID=3126691 RepID=UPI00300F3099
MDDKDADVSEQEDDLDRVFEKYRDVVDSHETMRDRMERLRGEYPRELDDPESEARVMTRIIMAEALSQSGFGDVGVINREEVIESPEQMRILAYLEGGSKTISQLVAELEREREKVTDEINRLGILGHVTKEQIGDEIKVSLASGTVVVEPLAISDDAVDNVFDSIN